MKFKKNLFLLILLTIIFVYITNISLVPENLTLFQNEEYELNLLKGIEIKAESFAQSSNTQKLSYISEETFVRNENRIQTDLIGTIKLKLTALGIIPIKDISVSVVPERLVIPAGETLGVKVYSKGVLVVGKSIVEGIDGKDYEPYVKTNIEIGDIIFEIDGKSIETIDDLQTVIQASNGEEMKISYEKNGTVIEEKITAVKTIDKNAYKIGLWVRDGAMGIGTLSFIDIETGKFAALGHRVSDTDTKQKIASVAGTLNDVKIVSVNKGEKNSPGEILGILDNDETVGTIEKNTEIGIYGNLTAEKLAEYSTNNAVKVASRNEVELGKATILCTLEEGNVEEYEIEIQKKFLEKENSSKCMIIKVTDENLLAKTGGIIQGMSGSPILQNGKLIGSVTHVFVNDPTRGYAVFADMMLQELLSSENYLE